MRIANKKLIIYLLQLGNRRIGIKEAHDIIKKMEVKRDVGKLQKK